MARRDEGWLYLLMLMPWWVGVAAAVAVLVGFGAILPMLFANDPMLKMVAQVMRMLAPVLALACLAAAAFSAFRSFVTRRRFDGQTGIESIRVLDWKSFEDLLGEYYRRQGYGVEERLSGGPDGGIDLILRKDGRCTLVQCKQWRTWKVGVNVAREMFGLLHEHNAAGVVVVTSGVFTQEARSFAQGKPIELIEGDALVSMIRSVQTNLPAVPGSTPSATPPPPPFAAAAVPVCPQCGKPMVIREARRGANTGKKFWGCPGYPACKGTRQLEG